MEGITSSTMPTESSRSVHSRTSQPRSQELEVVQGIVTSSVISILSTMVISITVIAALGMAGTISGSAMGWTLTGIFGSGALVGVSSMCQGQTKKDKLKKIMMAVILVAFTTISALTACGILTPTVLGWSIFGSAISATGLFCLSSPCLIRNHIKKHGGSKLEFESFER